MQIGAVFPQTEIGADPGAARAFAAAAADLGFRHLLAYDHVLGADPSVHPGWSGPYDLADTFHEPLTLFAWLAGQPDLAGLGFATAILVGPQRQTALLAKQAAELEILSGGGRFRLGLGIGWNPVEFQALGMAFSDRARRMEEQVQLLRRLWSEESVTFHGAHHRVEGAGLAPLPPGGVIPIWLGAMAPPALRRVGRVADGWFPQARPGGGLEEAMEVVAAAAREAGRDPAHIGMEGQVLAAGTDPERLASQAGKWRRAGATHLAVNTMGSGPIERHLEALASAAVALRPAAG